MKTLESVPVHEFLELNVLVLQAAVIETASLLDGRHFDAVLALLKPTARATYGLSRIMFRLHELVLAPLWYILYPLAGLVPLKLMRPRLIRRRHTLGDIRLFEFMTATDSARLETAEASMVFLVAA